jgi:ABC-type uncharacterized transport system fused permease/ATPase subunit
MQRMAWTDERLEERFDRIDVRFDDVDRRFDEAEERNRMRFDEAEERNRMRFDEAEERNRVRFEAVHRRIDETNVRLVSIEVQLSEVRQGLASLNMTISRGSLALLVGLISLAIALFVKGG